MRKYLIAALVGLAVVAMTAFAASLDVHAGTLQAGQDDIDQCVAAADDIEVSYDDPVFEDGVWLVSQLILTAPTTACDDLTFHVVVSGTDNPDTPAKSGVFDGVTGTVTYDVDDDTDERFDAEDATDVHIAIHNAPPTP